MATSEDQLMPGLDSRAAIRVNNRLYLGPTYVKCTTCGVPDRYMFVKSDTDNTAFLECPFCDTCQSVLKSDLRGLEP
jgi:translation initiation factor 2 beta subunit (eIF-2beta)/eIF-5